MLRAVLHLSLWAALAGCGDRATSITLVTTTSTQDSGLLDRLVPAAERALGLRVKVIAVGSGEALALAARGEADVVIAHAPAAEEAAVAAGDLVERAPLMWNRFVLVGPPADPAKIAGLGDPLEALRRIRRAGAPFVSRGDESGTHKKELELWEAAGLAPKDPHVVEAGQGQAETLFIAGQRAAYALCDSSTWANVAPRGLAVLLDTHGRRVAGAPSLANPYHLMRENEARHPSTNASAARRFVEWAGGPAAAPIISASGFALGAPPVD